jgi:hypothetical protein
MVKLWKREKLFSFFLHKRCKKCLRVFVYMSTLLMPWSYRPAPPDPARKWLASLLLIRTEVLNKCSVSSNCRRTVRRLWCSSFRSMGAHFPRTLRPIDPLSFPSHPVGRRRPIGFAATSNYEPLPALTDDLLEEIFIACATFHSAPSALLRYAGGWGVSCLHYRNS